MQPRSAIGARLAPACAGRDGERRHGGEQGADDEQDDACPERRVELGSDAQLGGDSSRSVGVHDDGAPATVLRLPLERLFTEPARGGDPEVLVAGRRGRRVAHPLRVFGVLPDVRHDGVLDAVQILIDVGIPGDADEDVAIALAADADVAEDGPRGVLGAAEVHVDAV